MIDSKRQTELRAKFNPDNSDLRKIQLRMLGMLKYIDKICKENDIHYWLSSGTCLGAIRHGGFIPWDDDVDIEMLKPDFEKLRKAILKDPEQPYYWQDWSNDENYVYYFPKLRDKNSIIEEQISESHDYKYKGIFIDIFIITPSNSVILRRGFTSLYTRLCNFSLSLSNTKIKQLIKYFANKVIVPIAEFPQSLFSQGKLRHQTGSGFLKPRHKKDIEETTYVKFEDTLLPVPKNFDSYLTGLFGNYQELPDLTTISTHITNTKFL